LLAAPAVSSSFSSTYYLDWPLEAYEDVVGYSDFGGYDMFKHPTVFMSPSPDELLGHYMRRVISIQYLLADKDLTEIIFESVSLNVASMHAVKLLASVHNKRFQRPDLPVLRTYDPDTQERLSTLHTLLTRDDLFTEDAMAALHVVSSILFDGGRGSWKQWLQIANNYVDNLFARYHGPAEALLRCSAKDAFVVKTAIWFDVLASVTTQQSPYFLEAIRAMFDPNRSGIYDPSLTVPPQYSMMSPMGCENHVVWALAEISDLSAWKRHQTRAGSLSVNELVLKASCIEEYLKVPIQTYTDLPAVELECSRHLTSEIFRTSSRLYLRSIVSGDHPDVLEIKESVEDTVRCIQQIPIDVPNVTRSVVRSTVFSFFICGALGEESHRRTILNLLEREMGESVGNCSSVLTLLEELWYERSQHLARRDPSPPVEWRKRLKDSQMLLV